MGVSPVRQLNPYNGLANPRFHTLLFGINGLRSAELPHGWANHSSRASVRPLYNRFSTAIARGFFGPLLHSRQRVLRYHIAVDNVAVD